MAHVLAMVMATHSEFDPRELRMLEGLDAFRRIGVSEPAFLRIARRYRAGSCRDLARHQWLHAVDLDTVDRILDEVRDPDQRLLLCRLAGCVITADGHVDEIELEIYDRMLLRWGYTRESVAKAILTQHVH
jgi:hypothetical protein